MSFGIELIIDVEKVKNIITREGIKSYLKELCKLINMEREDLHFWDYADDPEDYAKAPVHLKGISAVQFIKTSNITIHTLDDLQEIYINIFSCKEFHIGKTLAFTEDFFLGDIKNYATIKRG